jgi:hypothetical protein
MIGWKTGRLSTSGVTTNTIKDMVIRCSRLEPYEGRPSRTVLRGLGREQFLPGYPVGSVRNKDSVTYDWHGSGQWAEAASLTAVQIPSPDRHNK